MSEERVAVVTGSARGIGRAIAEALVASGHRVVGADIREHERGPMDQVIQVDLAEPDECKGLIAQVGRVDVLVNNAGILIEKPIEEFSVEEFDRTVAVNLRPVFLLSQAVLVGMRQRGWGRIISISSIGARTGGVSHSGVYAATKAGIIALSKNIARHYGQYGVTANAVAPGAVDTPMVQGQLLITPDMKEQLLPQIPLRRFSEPSEVASVVDFLASEGASFITGATVDVNGGWVME